MRGLGTKFHSSLIIGDIYTKFKSHAKLCGIYFLAQPVILLLDIDLIKSVLVRDFNNFDNRAVYYNEKDDPLSANLFSVHGKKWKPLRTKLTPTFTSGKMKFMFPTIVEVGDRFYECLKSIVEQNDELEIKELLSRFTTDVIGTCAFGIDCNSLQNPNAEFRRIGRKTFENPRQSVFFALFVNSFKDLSRKLHVKVFSNDVSEFFLNVVRETVSYREQNNINRNDFMDLLIKIKNTKSVDAGLTINEIAAQAFEFFLAGFETSSSALGFCLYELAMNPDIQMKTRREIQDKIAEHNGKFTYECMIDMP